MCKYHGLKLHDPNCLFRAAALRLAYFEYWLFTVVIPITVVIQITAVNPTMCVLVIRVDM